MLVITSRNPANTPPRKFAVKHGFSVNRQFSGHGIGRHFHQPPWIYHYCVLVQQRT